MAERCEALERINASARRSGAALLAALVAAGGVGGLSAAPGGSVRLELNKAEEQPGGCRLYMVLANGTAETFSDYRLDLVVFGKDEVIARRFAVDISPMRANKTTVKLFDVAGVPCKDIGKVLLNDILSCKVGKDPHASCINDVAVASRANIGFTK